jgi:hypothetical protein
MTLDWTPEQLKQCRELTKLVRKVSALKKANPYGANPQVRRLIERHVKDAERLVKAQRGKKIETPQ